MDDIEDLLKRYRPVGPPNDLRTRLTTPVDAPSGRAAARGWALVAAMLVCATLFYSLAAQEHQRIAAAFPAAADPSATAPAPELWP